MPTHDGSFNFSTNAADAGMVEEAGPQVLFDHGVYPIQRLPLSAFYECAAGRDELPEIADHFPDGVDAFAVESRAGVGFGAPALGGWGEVMQRSVVVGFGGVGADLVVAIGLIDQQRIGQLHDAFLDAL